MLKIFTHLLIPNSDNQSNNSQYVRIDNDINIEMISKYIFNTFNQYSIEIIYNENSLTEFQIVTIEPWVTYLLLMKNYLIKDFARVTDLSKPITYVFTKDEHGQFVFHIIDKLNQLTHQVILPEKEFFHTLYESLMIYLQFMKRCNVNYYQYWMSRYEKHIYIVRKQMESKYFHTSFNH